MIVVLLCALIGGMSLGQAAPNVKYFQQGRIAGARVFSMINRYSQEPLLSLHAPHTSHLTAHLLPS